MKAQALAWLAAGRAAMVVEVAAHRGSVPRETGTRMLVASDEVVGTIGGGHLELQAIERARGMLGAGAFTGAVTGAVTGAATDLQQVALGPSLGQCCGGALALRYTALAAAEPAAWPEPVPRFRLQLYGAGHVGRAIVQLLTRLPCQVRWIDERESEFPAGPLPPHIERVCVEPVEAEVASAAPGSCFLVLTHSHDLDLALARAVLARGDFRWFGLIGSATKRARFERRLAARGLTAEVMARMVCPIGVPGVAGKEPEVIALAVVTQLLMLR